ncbi:hypothetical protein WJR50_33035 [Catalinimonas sp. 4WD22]|uniref:hypothetical protein n=1 Tax=Catalinimonas locisalis TaxID=3133978 RepID=UPI0031010D3F
MSEKTTKRGPKSKYQNKYAQQAMKLCMLGATDNELADFFEVTEPTINNWKKDYPDFAEALRKGKIDSDAEVAARLFKRAIGYEHEDTYISQYQGQIITAKVIKRYPPDTQAAIHWLKNRRPDQWRDQKDFNHKHEGEPYDVKKTLEEFFGSHEGDD